MKSDVMCKHCKSTAHSTLEHRKHYKNFQEENKEKLREKHMKMFDSGREAGAGEDLKKKHKKDVGSDEKEYKREDKHEKAMPSLTTKHTGKFEGKSNALGHGGRAAQLKARGVPGGVIGNLAREAHAAPGEANYHGKHKKIMNMMVKRTPIKDTVPNEQQQSYYPRLSAQAMGQRAGLMQFGSTAGVRPTAQGNAESTPASVPIQRKKMPKHEKKA